MDKVNQKKMEECPSFEDISAFYDGELDQNSPVAEHLQNCDVCKEELESIKIINEKIQLSRSRAVPRDLTRKIKYRIAKLEEEQETRSKTISFPFRKFLQFAAAIAICSGIAFFAFKDSFTPSNSTNNIVTGPRTKPVSSSYNYPYYTSTTSNTPGQGISINNLTGASYGEGTIPVFTNVDQMIDKQKPAVIDSQVHQVWVVKNLDKATKTLGETLNELNIPQSKVKLAENDKSIKMIVNLSKIQLVTLVRNCKAKGFDLISPNEPQPEQQVFLGSKNQPVYYYAEFVKDK